MKKNEIHAAIRRSISEQNEIAMQYGFTGLQAYTEKYYSEYMHKPREPAQTGDKKLLTKRRKHGIFGMMKRHVRRVCKKIRRKRK